MSKHWRKPLCTHTPVSKFTKKHRNNPISNILFKFLTKSHIYPKSIIFQKASRDDASIFFTESGVSRVTVLKVREVKTASMMLTVLVRTGRRAASALYPIMLSRHETNWCHSIWPAVPPGWLRWQYQRQCISIAASRGNVWRKASRHRLTAHCTNT